MRSAFSIIIILTASIHALGALYINGGKKGLGIGYEAHHISLFFHCGSDVDAGYQHYERKADSNGSLYTFTDNNYSVCFYPYIGLGFDIFNKPYLKIAPYFDFLQGYSLTFKRTKQYGNSSLQSSRGNFTFTPGGHYFWRAGLKLTTTKWKMPIGLSVDADYVGADRSYWGFEVMPKLVVYLK